MLQSILEQIDLNKSEDNIIDGIFESYIKYFQDLNLEDGLFDVIEKFIKSMQSHWEQTGEITSIIDLAPESDYTLEYHVCHTLYALIEQAYASIDESKPEAISESIANQVEEKIEEDSYLSLTTEQATNIVIQNIYNNPFNPSSNISFLESKAKFIQFYFASPENKIKIIESLNPNQVKCFIIAAWEVIKKVQNVNPQVTKRLSKKFKRALELDTERSQGSHHHHGVLLFDPSTDSQERTFLCWSESVCSVKKSKVWMSKVVPEFAGMMENLHKLCIQLSEQSNSREYSQELEENFNIFYRLVTKFIETISEYTNFYKFKI